jgi:hypothetical protein
METPTPRSESSRDDHEARIAQTLEARFNGRVELDDLDVSALHGIEVSGGGLRIYPVDSASVRTMFTITTSPGFAGVRQDTGSLVRKLKLARAAVTYMEAPKILSCRT